jgi:flagellar basal-body rod protein FlgF
MSRGIYTAASGLITCSEAMNVAGNNIVNASTAGFKQDQLIAKAFDEYLVDQITGNSSKMIGSVSHGVVPDEVYTYYSQGALESTGISTNLAITGDGFFTVQNGDGDMLLTRNGEFSINSDGLLTDTQGNLVMGTNGTIKVSTSDFSVTADGEIFAGGATCGTLKITCPSDLSSLVKVGDNLFSCDSSDSGTFSGSIKQGYLEGSNVDMVDSMSDMMALARSYQSCSQILKMIDTVTEKTVTELARI